MKRLLIIIFLVIGLAFLGGCTKKNQPKSDVENKTTIESENEIDDVSDSLDEDFDDIDDLDLNELEN